MFIELTQKTLGHLNAFTALKRSQIGARDREATLVTEEIVEAIRREREAIKINATRQTLGKLTQVTGVGVVTVSGPVSPTVIDAIQNYRPRKVESDPRCGRKVISVMTSYSRPKDETYLRIRTTNAQRVQCGDDIAGWLIGKSLGGGVMRQGFLQKLGVRVEKFHVEDVVVTNI
jgi:hypothetical protein